MIKRMEHVGIVVDDLAADLRPTRTIRWIGWGIITANLATIARTVAARP